MNRFRKCLRFFDDEMALRAEATALDQLNNIIDATFSSIEQYYIAIVVHVA